MERGLLAIWNAVTPDHEVQFNDWYDNEHVIERLALPGFNTATRYRSTDGAHRYCALYEVDSVAALSSPEYLGRLADPTLATTAIMAQFRDMNRAVCNLQIDTGVLPVPGKVIVIMQIDEAAAGAISGATVQGLAKEQGLRIRVAQPDAARTQVQTPEQKLRQEPDKLPSTLLLVEGDDAQICRNAAQTLAPGSTPLNFALIYQRKSH